AHELLAVAVGALDRPRAFRRIQPGHGPRHLLARRRRLATRGGLAASAFQDLSDHGPLPSTTVRAGSIRSLSRAIAGSSGGARPTALRCNAMWPRWMPSVASARRAARFDARPALPIAIASRVEDVPA